MTDARPDTATYREKLDDECRKCSKPKAEANEIVPVSNGHWSFGPNWSCEDCMGKVGVTDE